jgi:hypothetical protein
MNVTAKPFLAGSVALLLAACGDSAKLPEEAAFGPHPALPEPTETTIPTINIARAKGWRRSLRWSRRTAVQGRLGPVDRRSGQGHPPEAISKSQASRLCEPIGCLI